MNEALNLVSNDCILNTIWAGSFSDTRLSYLPDTQLLICYRQVQCIPSAHLSPEKKVEGAYTTATPAMQKNLQGEPLRGNRRPSRKKRTRELQYLGSRLRPLNLFTPTVTSSTMVLVKIIG